MMSFVQSTVVTKPKQAIAGHVHSATGGRENSGGSEGDLAFPVNLPRRFEEADYFLS
jgi:hypothetical protein